MSQNPSLIVIPKYSSKGIVKTHQIQFDKQFPRMLHHSLDTEEYAEILKYIETIVNRMFKDFFNAQKIKILYNIPILVIPVVNLYRHSSLKLNYKKQVLVLESNIDAFITQLNDELFLEEYGINIISYWESVKDGRSTGVRRELRIIFNLI